MPFQIGDVVRRRNVDHLENGESNRPSIFPEHYALGGTGIVISVSAAGGYIDLDPPNHGRVNVER